MKSIEEILDGVKFERITPDMLETGDILIISIPQRVDRKYVDQVRKDFRTVIPEDIRILILTGGINLSVLKSDGWVE